jgi:3-hydroxybutyryl-CoA dehydrogenase
MGSGIAQVAAAAGYDVVLRDVGLEALERGLSAIRRSLDRFVAKGRVGEADAKATESPVWPLARLRR